MRTFASVVDEGSFAAAARRLELNQAVVTRLVADLESHLGARLLNRTTRSLSLTEAGEVYLQRCRQILADVETAEEMVGAGTSSIAGRVRIAVPVVFGLEMFAPRFKKFRTRYPNITLDVGLFDRAIDPTAEGYDLAITPSTFGLSTSLVARPLAEKPIVLCASPGYLKAAGTPQQPADLSRHDCIGFSLAPHRDQWKLTASDGTRVTVPVNLILQSNNFAMLRYAVREDGGIGTLIQYSVADELTDGRLVRVLPDWEIGSVALTIVYPSREYMPRRVRALIDFIIEERDATLASERAGEAEAVG
jgi:DNA-binding transcriptional LysR family regulator